MRYLLPSDCEISDASWGCDSPIARYRRMISELGDGKRRQDEDRYIGPPSEIHPLHAAILRDNPVKKLGGRLDPPVTRDWRGGK